MLAATASKRSDELRIRASNLDLAAIEGLRSMAAKLSPDLGEIWLATQPSGKIEPGAGYPAAGDGKNPFPGQWKDLAWKQWKLLPGAEHFSGKLKAALRTAG
jgi:uncharacterized protein YhdP